MGAFASDGSSLLDRNSYHYRTTIVLSIDQSEYAQILADKMEKVLGKRPNVWRYPRQNTIRVTIHGKEILNFLRRFLSWTGNKTHTIAFRREWLIRSKSFRIGVIRGLIAGDGSVSVQKSCVSFAVTSKRLAKQYAEALELSGIESHWHSSRRRRRRAPIHSVTVRGVHSLNKLNSRIGLTDPLRRNLLNKILERR